MVTVMQQSFFPLQVAGWPGEKRFGGTVQPRATGFPDGFRPLLAVEAAGDISFPVLASPKIDGIRCLTGAQGPLTRSMKPIPNRHIQAKLAGLPVGLDGELLTFTNGERDDFNTVQSKVMRAAGEPDFLFMLFDNALAEGGFEERFATLATFTDVRHLAIVPHLPIADAGALDVFETACVETHGWEGVMLRKPDGRYKHGRSTLKEGILLKVKRFADDEAVITGCVEMMENTNAATTDAFGHVQRSTARDGLVPKGTLGALVCQWKDVTFELGTGFTESQRADLWRRRDSLPGLKVTFKFQGTGTNGRPRFPSFRGVRHDF